MEDMIKTCERCTTKYEKTGKGSTRAKYCEVCKPIARKEQQKVSTQKSEDAKRQLRGNIIPNQDELLFYGYKEPLRKFENGYGYKGVLSYSKDRDMVQCHFCGRLYKNVGSHAYFTHGYTRNEYKDKTGLEHNTALVGEGTRTKLILAHKDTDSFSHVGKSREEINSHMTAMSKKADRSNNGKWSLERRNKHGLCPDQLLDRVKTLETKLGRRPTAKEYAKEYGSYQSIITVYGTWNTALEKADIRTYTEEKSGRSSPEWLLSQLQDFYKKYGRTARTSDGRRGLVPSHQIYHKVFGSFNNARILAGVPVIIPLSKYRYDEVIIEDAGQLNRIKENLNLL